MSSLLKCYFDYDTLITKVGTKEKGYREIKAIQVPTYSRIVREKEDLGNGWYSSKSITVKKEYKYNFVLIENGKLLGVLLHPYDKTIKSDIHPINSKYVADEIRTFIKSLVVGIS